MVLLVAGYSSTLEEPGRYELSDSCTNSSKRLTASPPIDGMTCEYTSSSVIGDDHRPKAASVLRSVPARR